MKRYSGLAFYFISKKAQVTAHSLSFRPMRLESGELFHGLILKDLSAPRHTARDDTGM